jgi:hypothetical protein
MSDLRDREPFRKVQLTAAAKLIAGHTRAGELSPALLDPSVRVLEEQDQDDDDEDDDERAHTDVHMTSLREA